MSNTLFKEIHIPLKKGEIQGNLVIPEAASVIIIFSHGRGSNRYSPRNNFVARRLQQAGLATLLLDLINENEDRDYEKRFNTSLFTKRLIATSNFLSILPVTQQLQQAIFGASTGAAPAISAAAKLGDKINALVCRGGRPDLAGDEDLNSLSTPSLFIVGGEDPAIIELNQIALEKMHCKKALELIPGATHLFEEQGALEKVTTLALDWFEQNLIKKNV